MEVAGFFGGSEAGFRPIVVLDLGVTPSEATLAAVNGPPIGALIAVTRFPGRGFMVLTVDALMGLPPVAAGLSIHLVLSRSDPLGFLGRPFTPEAMILAQALLVLPIVVARPPQTVEGLRRNCAAHFASLDLVGARAVPTLSWEARFSRITGLLAGFGRASAEVGTVSIVGGDMVGHTRTMTTAFALETSNADLPFALDLGGASIVLTVAFDALVFGIGRVARRDAG